MPKASMIAKSNKQELAANNTNVLANRKELKTMLKTEQGIQAMMKLNKKRNNSRTRTVNRCKCCKRPRGVYRYFNLCRLCLIKYASQGIIPGLRLSSW